MLMGDVCTRNCPYCAVTHGRARPLDADEPRRIAAAVAAPRPAARGRHLGRSRRSARWRRRPFRRDCQRDQIGAARSPASKFWCPISRAPTRASRPSSIRLSISTTTISRRCPRLYRQCRPGGRYELSLDVLKHAKETARAAGRDLLTKAGLMLGLGEQRDELMRTLADLRAVECDILTLGQYLRALARSSAGGALCSSRGIRGNQNRRARTRLSSRRIRPAGAQLLSCVGARELTAARSLALAVAARHE